MESASSVELFEGSTRYTVWLTAFMYWKMIREKMQPILITSLNNASDTVTNDIQKSITYSPETSSGPC